MKENIQLAEAYFKDIGDIHQTGGGVKEESYYGSLANLLNGIGKSLKPQVKCIIELINRGAGHPDGGLFTKEQWDHGNKQAPLLGQVPARGVIEIKPTSDDTWVTAESEQVSNQLGSLGCLVGAVAVYQQVHVSFNIGKHPANYMTLALLCLASNDKTSESKLLRLFASESKKRLKQQLGAFRLRGEVDDHV